MRIVRLLAGSALLAVVTAGCGLLGSSSSSAPPAGMTPAAPAPATAAMHTTPPAVHTTPPAVPTTPPARAMAPVTTCQAGHLGITLGSNGHAAGSEYQAIAFTNTGPAACTLAGYPGAALTTARSASSQLGAAASRDPAAVRTVTLQPDQSATARLRISDAANYPQTQGHIVTAAYLQVYAPGTGAAAYLPDMVQGTTVTSVSLLAVSPVGS